MVSTSRRRKLHHGAIHCVSLYDDEDYLIDDKPCNYPCHVQVEPSEHVTLARFIETEDFVDGSSRVLVLGLNYECRSFMTLSDAWKHISSVFEGRCGEKPEKLHTASGSGAHRCEPLWIDIQAPTIKDRNLLNEHMNISVDLASGVLDRCILYKNHLYTSLVVNSNSENISSPLEQVEIVLHQNYIITIHASPLFQLNTVIHRIYATHYREDKILIPGPDWILYAMLDATVDFYSSVIEGISSEIENLDTLVFVLNHSEHDELLQRLGATRKNIILMRRLQHPKNDVMSRMVTRSEVARYLSKQTRYYIRDVLDHSGQNIESLDHSREALVNTQTNYMSKMQIDLSRETSDGSQYMGKIAVLATILAPNMLITGLFGMNVTVPGGWDPMGTTWWWGIVGFMFISTMILMLLVRKQILIVRED
ncbi:metal ion transporter [Acrasis kona]|uniref:Metal ion transporter n=1 Tax=Acrasis kona TaxID=1008807 RepID=A0AAW2Z065_9EUKA